MTKYKLRALSIHMNGQVFKKGKNEPKGGFSTPQFSEKTLKEAEEAGFLEVVKEEKPEPKTEPQPKKPTPKPKK